jgi:hypothetical protein
MRILFNSAAVVAVVAILPSLLMAQGSARDALSIFPADTQQFAYANLAQLREQPDYTLIQSRLLSSQLKNFSDFIRSMGMDPGRDVDEVTLGWHGDLNDSSAYYGLAWGRFEPERIHAFFVQQKLPWQQYGGYDLYAFGSGETRRDLFFAFLNSSEAVFGRLHDLKILIDVNAGSQQALNRVQEFVQYEGELEGTSSQWGIATGPAAANRAAPWLGGGNDKLPFDPNALLKPVRAVLYRMDWSNGVTTHMSVVCDNDQSASMISQLVVAWQSVRASTPGIDPGVAQFIQGLQVSANGSRVEVTGQAPLQVVGQILGGPAMPAQSP